MKNIQTNTMPFWYLATLIFTGALLLLHFIWENVGNYSVSFTQFGPLFATLLIIYITKDKASLAKIHNGMRINLHNYKWILLALALPFFVTGVSSVVLSTLFEDKFVSWDGDLTFYAINFIAMMLGSIGEEIGWRGYLQPTLNQRFTPFLSSVLVGCLWGFWHLNYVTDPVFWLVFIISTIELSIIFTYLLHKSTGSLWTSIIFHTFINFSHRLFLWERFNTKTWLIEIIVLAIICIVILILNRKQMFHKPIK